MGTVVVVVFFTLLGSAPGLAFYLTSGDHGFQLGLGRAILLGKFPFVDLFFHYGPLTAFTSAAGLWIDDSLIPETIICTLGYTVSLVLIYSLTCRYVGRIAALASLAVGLLLLARFYKWYYWLFPMTMLYRVHASINGPRRIGEIGGSGSVAGVAALYRVDLGLVCAVCYVFPLLLLPPSDRRSRHAAVFGVFFLLPIGTWLAILMATGGVLAPLDYWDATFVQGTRMVLAMSQPLPRLEWSLSAQSGVALAYALMPATYLACLVVGLRGIRRETERPDAVMMAAVAGAGLAMFPQALHRREAFHLLQVLPPILIASPLLIRWLWRSRARHGGLEAGIARGALAAYLLLLAIAFRGLQGAGAVDMESLAHVSAQKYRALKRGPGRPSDDPVGRVTAALRGMTLPGQSVLAASFAPQMYFFSDRPLSGVLHMYAVGWFDDDSWRRRNLGAVERDPPTAVLADEGFLGTPTSNPFRQSQPELYRFLSSRYTHVAYRADGWLILTQ